MGKRVVILGGGVIGLFSAYYLAKSGHSVTILDRQNVGKSSTGNAGMIVPSHVIPLAAPGMMAKGIRWMFNNKSPFYVKPRLNGDLFSWGWSFYRAANQTHVDNSTKALRDISLLSKKLYQELSEAANEFEYDEKGLLMLFQSEKIGLEEREVANVASNLGLEVEFLDQTDLKGLDYGVKTNASGAVLYKSDAHLQPNKLMAFLTTEVAKMNVQHIEVSKIQKIETRNNKVVQVVTGEDSYQADEFVVAAGAWSKELAKLAEERIQLLPGKGYSFTLPKMEHAPKIPTILCEGKVAVTAFQDQIRFGGTLEVTHVKDQSIHWNRVRGIVDTINSFYPEMEIKIPKEDEIWVGYRPCSPTGMPYIGRSTKYSNLTYATGHGMMGLSLGPATGFLVNGIISEEPAKLVDAFQL
ncbi:MAG: FAD-dependent oxidoreductase [bacterium]|nr:FAD-dependent oxidoreductase [bacterium]